MVASKPDTDYIVAVMGQTLETPLAVAIFRASYELNSPLPGTRNWYLNPPAISSSNLSAGWTIDSSNRDGNTYVQRVNELLFDGTDVLDQFGQEVGGSAHTSDFTTQTPTGTVVFVPDSWSNDSLLDDPTRNWLAAGGGHRFGKHILVK